MKDYEEAGETIMLVLPEEDEATIVEFEANPRRAKPHTVVLPPGPYEDLFVRVALIRSPHYGSQKPVRIGSSRDVYRIVKSMEHLPQESIFVLLLDSRNKLVGITEAVRGSWNKTMVEPTDVFRAAIVANAPAIIMVHNHPSGDVTASAEDIGMARSLIKAGDVLNIKLLDSVVVGASTWTSLADKGLME